MRDEKRVFESFPSLADYDALAFSGRVIFRMDEEDLVPRSEWTDDPMGDVTFRLGRETEIGSFFEDEDIYLEDAIEKLSWGELRPLFAEYDLELWSDTSEHCIVGFAVGDKEKATQVWNRIKEVLIEHGAFEVYDV